jgi:hypothetical protein
MAEPDIQIAVMPANQASREDIRSVFGTRGVSSTCHCQRYKLHPRESFGSFPAEERADRLVQQTGCGNPASESTSGLLAYTEAQPVGWCAVEPRIAYFGLAPYGSGSLGRPERGQKRFDGVGGHLPAHPGRLSREKG